MVKSDLNVRPKLQFRCKICAKFGGRGVGGGGGYVFCFVGLGRFHRGGFNVMLLIVCLQMAVCYHKKLINLICFRCLFVISNIVSVFYFTQKLHTLGFCWYFRITYLKFPISTMFIYISTMFIYKYVTWPQKGCTIRTECFNNHDNIVFLIPVTTLK